MKAKVDPTRTCPTCSGPVSLASKSGYCRLHSHHAPGFLERRVQALRKAFQTRPELSEANRRRLTELNRRPECRARSGEIARSVKLWEHGHANITAEVRQRIAQTQSAKKLAHIPPEVMDMYLDLTRRARVPAPEATELVLAHHEKNMAAFRRKLGAA